MFLYVIDEYFELSSGVEAASDTLLWFQLEEYFKSQVSENKNLTSISLNAS